VGQFIKEGNGERHRRKKGEKDKKKRGGRRGKEEKIKEKEERRGRKGGKGKDRFLAEFTSTHLFEGSGDRNQSGAAHLRH